MASLADPTESGAHFNRAVAFSRLAETDSTYAPLTLEEADRALKLTGPSDPNYPKALALVGRQLVVLDRVEEAPAHFKTLIEESPASYPVLEEIGNDALNQKRWKGAAVFLKMTTEARAAAGEESFDVYYNTGVAFYNLGRETAKDPANEAVANGHLDEAIAFYDKALTLREDDPQTVLNIVAVTVVKKDWPNASLWCEKYVSVSPDDPRGWQFLTRIYTELGDADKAADARRRFEQLSSQTTE
jgi:tetratricopeptide (TPR) repeat protein